MLIRLASFAVIFRSTVLTFDMREHVWTQRAAPPCKTDFLGIALSTVGAGGILSWVLHSGLQDNDLRVIVLVREVYAINHE